MKRLILFVLILIGLSVQSKVDAQTTYENPYLKKYANPYLKYSTQNIVVSPRGSYLGNLNGNKYDPNSIANPYGQYGSKYSPNSVNNPYGQYGSKYSPTSANNSYAITTPKIYDRQTNTYKGKLSANQYDSESISNPYGQYGSVYSPNSIVNPYTPQSGSALPTTTVAPNSSSWANSKINQLLMMPKSQMANEISNMTPAQTTALMKALKIQK